jgi:anti-anti-sigma factor
MSVTVGSHGNVPVVQVMGRVGDNETPGTPLLSETLRSVCRRSSGTVVVDISGIQFLDSHGLGVLVFHNTIMERAGRQLIFLNTNRNKTAYMNRLFDCTNLARIFAIVHSIEQVEPF